MASTFAAADGLGYERQMGRWSRRLAPLFVDFAGTTGALRCLDVGCGTGHLGLCLAQDREVISVHGIDLSVAYVEYARGQDHDGRLSFEVGDACALPYADASFDHSLSMLALQFIPQAELAVSEMVRVTRRGGTVAAATWDTRGGLVANRLILDTAAMLDREGQALRARACIRLMSRPGDLARAWRHAGLMDIAQDMLTIRMDFASFADFWAPCEGRDGPIAEHISNLGAGARARLRDAVELAYLDGENDGARSYAATAWVIRGNVPLTGGDRVAR
jgi:SAM-dependent methyltransferase